MAYKHCCVVDAVGNYITFVLVQNGTVQHYTPLPGDALINAAPPALRPHAGAAGFVRPRWDADTNQWTEGATVVEIAAWEADHPAPVVPEQPPNNAQLAAENKLLREQVEEQADALVELAAMIVGEE